MKKDFFILYEKDSESLFMDSERVFSKEAIVNALKKENMSNVHVFLAITYNKSDMFYCKKNREYYDKYDDFISCGKTCSSYIPRNGKSGCCKYRKNAYTYIEGTEYILNVDGILEEIK